MLATTTLASAKPVRHRAGASPNWIAIQDLARIRSESKYGTSNTFDATPANARRLPAARSVRRKSLARYLAGLKLDALFTYVVSSSDVRDVNALPEGLTDNIINFRRVNDIKNLDSFLVAVNRKLPSGGIYVGCADTLEQETRAPRLQIAALGLHAFAFVFKRMLPRLMITRWLYARVLMERPLAISLAEVLGRLVRSGFEIVNHRVIQGRTYFIVRKTQPPSDTPPSFGLFLKMKRVGQGGKPIYVYKLRTMHPYSEFLQAYVYEQNKLQKNGKFNNDFRVTSWGKYLRKIWLDEVPMLLNWLRGDVKLVGIRPLSAHYLSLYAPDLAVRRLQHKPGLIPPFYSDLPQNFQEILESEDAYLRAYEAHPWSTDVRYLIRALFNIFVKRVRSK